MYKINYRVLFSSFLMFSCVLLTFGIGNPFVVKRHDKSSKASDALREEYCQACGDFLDQIPELLRKMAAAHERATHVVRGMVEGDKSSFGMKGTKQQLEQSIEKLHKIQCQLSQIMPALEAFSQDRSV
jgi:hypothetical protein